MAQVRYISVVVKHKPTGVLCQFYVKESASKGEIEQMTTYGLECNHIVVMGKIAKDKKYRRKGLWQADKDNSRWIFFTCPWCCGIGRVEDHYIGSNHSSLWCMNPLCRRHITLSFRKRGEEQTGFKPLIYNE